MLTFTTSKCVTRTDGKPSPDSCLYCDMYRQAVINRSNTHTADCYAITAQAVFVWVARELLALQLNKLKHYYVPWWTCRIITHTHIQCQWLSLISFYRSTVVWLTTADTSWVCLPTITVTGADKSVKVDLNTSWMSMHRTSLNTLIDWLMNSKILNQIKKCSLVNLPVQCLLIDYWLSEADRLCMLLIPLLQDSVSLSLFFPLARFACLSCSFFPACLPGWTAAIIITQLTTPYVRIVPAVGNKQLTGQPTAEIQNVVHCCFL